MKITGFDEFGKMLEEAQKALQSLDGEIGVVEYDPNDPGSIETAIQKMEQTIDERVGRYADNPLVAPLIDQAKEHYREVVIQKAAEARMGKTGNE